MIRTRFAPSPNGYLHIGHALSALINARRAESEGGQFLLRIEDIDTVRATSEFEQAIYEDLDWLGLRWETPVRRQSEHLAAYAAAQQRLMEMGLLYPCFCSRSQIAAASTKTGPDGPMYAGTCKHLSPAEIEDRTAAGMPFALRLHMDRAIERAGPLSWQDELAGSQNATPELFGDVVLTRKDIKTSYHIAVVVDDDLQQISHVIRGQDLFAATHVHRLLQALLGLQVPVWHHHRLITDEEGGKLSKSKKSPSLRDMRAQWISPETLATKLLEMFG